MSEVILTPNEDQLFLLDFLDNIFVSFCCWSQGPQKAYKACMEYHCQKALITEEEGYKRTSKTLAIPWVQWRGTPLIWPIRGCLSNIDKSTKRKHIRKAAEKHTAILKELQYGNSRQVLGHSLHGTTIPHSLQMSVLWGTLNQPTLYANIYHGLKRLW